MSLDEFMLKIDTSNAAFGYGVEEGERALEVARILRKAANTIEYNNILSGSLQDVNGNTVGHFEFK